MLNERGATLILPDLVLVVSPNIFLLHICNFYRSAAYGDCRSNPPISPIGGINEKDGRYLVGWL